MDDKARNEAMAWEMMAKSQAAAGVDQLNKTIPKRTIEDNQFERMIYFLRHLQERMVQLSMRLNETDLQCFGESPPVVDSKATPDRAVPQLSPFSGQIGEVSTQIYNVSNRLTDLEATAHNFLSKLSS
jgi:hypothetical protein